MHETDDRNQDALDAVGGHFVTEPTDPLYRPRHSAAHVLAHAVLDFFPDAKLGIGPPVADGFYYDFDLGRNSDGTPRTFSYEDLQRLEDRMREIIRENSAFEYRQVSADEACALFRDQPYKLELIDGLAAGTLDENGEETDTPPVISTYRIGRFLDLCRGPHVGHAGEIRGDALKLTSVSGAYWRGDERRPMLQRIYGTLWNTPTELDAYLKRLEEAKKRDHRKLGRDLDIYIFDEEVGPDYRSGYRTAASSSSRSSSSRRKPSARPVTTASALQNSRRTRCSSAADTCRTTPKVCTRRWSWRGRSTTSSR